LADDQVEKVKAVNRSEPTRGDAGATNVVEN
jgi:hypothetical protein